MAVVNIRQNVRETSDKCYNVPLIESIQGLLKSPVALIYWDEEDSVSVCPEGSIDPSLKDITVGALCSVRIGTKRYNGELAAKGNLNISVIMNIIHRN